MKQTNAQTLTRLMRFVRVTEGCWLWTGAKMVSNHGGDVRGRFFYRGRNCFASRVAFELYTGAPPKFEVCHTCDEGLCVRPDHLFDASHTENMRDSARKGRSCSYWAKKTQCKRGHPFDAVNTRWFTKPDGNKCRFCRACLKAYGKARYQANQKRG